MPHYSGGYGDKLAPESMSNYQTFRERKYCTNAAFFSGPISRAQTTGEESMSAALWT